MVIAQTPRRLMLVLLTASCVGCLDDGRPLAQYLAQMENFRAGLAAADAGADTLADADLSDTGPADAETSDGAAADAPAPDVAKPVDIMRWAGDGYVEPPGDPTCTVIETSGICSDQTGLPVIAVTLNFHNTCTSKTLRLYWYDSACKAHQYSEIGPNQWMTQQTFLGHAWRIVDSDTDELIAEHLVTTFQGGEVNLP